jgi:hypothetical protein
MKGKFKQWWSIIPPRSTKQTITSHRNWLNTKKGTTTYGVGNSGPGLGQAQKNHPMNDNKNMDSTITGSMNACS